MIEENLYGEPQFGGDVLNIFESELERCVVRPDVDHAMGSHDPSGFREDSRFEWSQAGAVQCLSFSVIACIITIEHIEDAHIIRACVGEAGIRPTARDETAIVLSLSVFHHECDDSIEPCIVIIDTHVCRIAPQIISIRKRSNAGTDMHLEPFSALRQIQSIHDELLNSI